MGNDKEITLVINAKEGAISVLQKVGDEYKQFGTNVADSTTKAAASADQGSETTKKALMGVSVGLAATGFALTAFSKNSTDSTVEYAMSVNRLSREIGTSAQQTSELIYAGKRMGLSADEASTSFGFLSKQIASTRDKTADQVIQEQSLQNKMQATKQEITAATTEIQRHGDVTGALKTKIQGLNIDMEKYQKQLGDTSGPLGQLGVATRNADGSSRSFNDILLNVADRFKAMPDGVEKTALSMQLFGRSGKDLIPLLNQGSDGIKDLSAQADKLGLTLTSDTIGKVKAYVSAQKDMNDEMQALKLRVGSETLPVLTSFQQKINDMTSALLDAPEPIRTATTDFLAFGGPVAGAASAVAGFTANMDQSLPMLQGLGGGVATVTSKLGPWGLALTAVAVAGGIVAVKMGVFNDVLKDNDKVTGTAAGSATLLSLFQARLTDTTDKQKKATVDLKKAHDDIAPSNATMIKATQTLNDAQGKVNDALTKYGSNSPQYQKATSDLSGAELAYRDAVHDASLKTLDLMGAQGKLRDANNDLRDATSTLNTFMRDQNKALGDIVTTVAQMGPTALLQIKPIADLGVQISTVVAQFRTAQGELQAGVASDIGNFQGLGSTIDKLQNTAKDLQKTTSGLKVQGGGQSNLQGNYGTAPVPGIYQARAGGGPVSGGQTYLVGEKGMELFVPRGDGYVIPNDQLKSGGTPAPTAATGGIQPNVIVNIGMYAGEPGEIRTVAARIYKELMNIARANGQTLPNIGVRSA